MTPVDAVGWLGTLSGTLLGLPQVLRLLRTRDVQGLSVTAWQALLTVNLAWTAHGLRIDQAPQVVTSVLSLCSTVPVLVLAARARGLPGPRAAAPAVLAAAALVGVDQVWGTALFGALAVLPAVLANAGQTVELVRAPRVSGVSPVFLALAVVNQGIWVTWALLVPDTGTVIAATVTGIGAVVTLGWWLARRAGLPPLGARAAVEAA